MNTYLKTQAKLLAVLMVKEVLAKGIVSIEFYKADDTVRPMRATLDPNLLPASEKKDEYDSAIDLNVVKVFDVEATAWRSFRMDRLKSIDGLDYKLYFNNFFESAI